MYFKIYVPATSANLGSGFDSAGLALNRYNEFTFDFTQEGIKFFDEIYQFDTSLTLDSFFKTLTLLDVEHPKNVHLTTVSNIPIARGLGSSSTCIVAGVLAANHFAKTNLSLEKLALIATKLEGHPDNVVSAIYGSLNLSLYEEKLFNNNVTVHQDLYFIALVPDHTVKTSEARNILPTSYEMGDIVFNLSRVSFIEKAFSTLDEELLKIVTQDRLHQSYRKQLIQDFKQIDNALKHPKIITSWISGAGPTMMALCHRDNTKEISDHLSRKLPKSIQILSLQIEPKGAMIK